MFPVTSYHKLLRVLVAATVYRRNSLNCFAPITCPLLQVCKEKAFDQWVVRTPPYVGSLPYDTDKGNVPQRHVFFDGEHARAPAQPPQREKRPNHFDADRSAAEKRKKQLVWTRGQQGQQGQQGQAHGNIPANYSHGHGFGGYGQGGHVQGQQAQYGQLHGGGGGGGSGGFPRGGGQNERTTMHGGFRKKHYN